MQQLSAIFESFIPQKCWLYVHYDTNYSWILERVKLSYIINTWFFHASIFLAFFSIYSNQVGGPVKWDEGHELVLQIGITWAEFEILKFLLYFNLCEGSVECIIFLSYIEHSWNLKLNSEIRSNMFELLETLIYVLPSLLVKSFFITLLV